MKRRGHNTYSDIALQIIQLAIAVIYRLVIYCLLLTYCYRCYPLFSILQYGHHIVHTMLHAEVFRNIMAAHWCLGFLFLRLELDKIRNDRVRVSWLHAESHVLLIRQLSLEFIRHTARLCSFYMMIVGSNGTVMYLFTRKGIQRAGYCFFQSRRETVWCTDVKLYDLCIIIHSQKWLFSFVLFPDAGGLLRNSHSRAQELFVNTMLGMLGMFTGWSMLWICKTLVISVSILTNLTCLDLRRQKLSSKLNGTWPKEGQLSLGCLALCLCAVKVLPFAGSQSQFVHINDLGIDHVRLAALLGRG